MSAAPAGAPLSPEPPRILEIGRIVKPHGLRGEVIVDMVTNRPEPRLAPGSVLASDRGPMEVLRSSPHQKRWIVAFAGVADRNGAEALRNTLLLGEAVEEEGALWVHELIGAELFDLAGISYGRVVEVEANPASDLLVLADGTLVPLTFVVDSGDGRVVVDPPQGLLTNPMTDAPLVPRQVLFGNPERISPHISPDGTRLGWIAPDEGVLNVWVAPVGAMAEARAVTRDRDRGIRSFTWAHDDLHLLYIQDKGGDENWRLYAVNLESGSIRDLTPFEGVQARIEDLDKGFPNHVLVGLNNDNPERHDVYRLDLATGELELVAKNPGFIGFLADADFRVRAAAAPTPDGGMVVLVRDTPDDEWRPLLEVGQEDALSTSPVAFSRDGSGIYAITSVGSNSARLVRIDCASGEISTLAEDPTYDVSSVRLHPDTRVPQMVSFVRERLSHSVLDPAIADDIAGLAALEAGDLVLQGEDDADETWLAAFLADDGPVRYYAWNRASRQATFLFEHQPALGQYTLAAMEPFSLTARDGLTLHGYLTFPVGVPRAGLPTVLNVHGGPWGRDAWGFNAEAQWLANRGYLCVQVNFRGSTGYGKAFTNAGDRQWGAAMHDDLLDAVAEVVGQGWADPARIAIYGGSYGGYAALVGATFTPDVFACAVDIVGPSNLKTLIESIPPYWAPMIAQFHTRVGNPETEADFLWSRSPLSRAADVRVPLLIAQGANDPRVKQAESEQIVAALLANRIDHEYMLFADEGHGFAKPENRLRFYAAAERFLAHHLGGRYEEESPSQAELARRVG